MPIKDIKLGKRRRLSGTCIEDERRGEKEVNNTRNCELYTDFINTVFIHLKAEFIACSYGNMYIVYTILDELNYRR